MTGLRPVNRRRQFVPPGSAIHFLAVLAAFTSACGYHVGNNTQWMPKTVRTIAIPAFSNGTLRPKLARLLPDGITREFHTRTKYTIVADPNQADAVLNGTLVTWSAFPIIFDIQSGRATGVEVVVTVQVTLTERATGKVLFTQPSLVCRERYEIAADPQTYFDESGTAMERVARDASRTIVSAILEKF
jgi:outer membrane lipopolysaccharide assembly protein LptE/RlpB